MLRVDPKLESLQRDPGFDCILGQAFGPQLVVARAS
jgi:hypothetical protein